MHPRLWPAAARPVELVRADVDQAAGMAVIGRIQHDQMFVAGVCARQPQCQLIRLAGRVENEADAQRLGHQRRQPLGVARQVVVQVARVGVEQRQLRLGGVHHARVAVADNRHIVVHVEKRAPSFVIQILHPAAHKLERLLIRDAQVAADPRPPRGQRLGLAMARAQESGRRECQGSDLGRARGLSRPRAGWHTPRRENRDPDRADR